MKTRGYINCPYCKALITVESRGTHVLFTHPAKWLTEQQRSGTLYAESILVQNNLSSDSVIARILQK